MQHKILILALLGIALSSCDPEPTGPESDCHLHDLYTLGYHAIDASKVFDLRQDPPLEIRNGSIEYDLSSQSINIINLSPSTYPCSEYFIDSIVFSGEASAVVKIFERDDQRAYSVSRNDCQLVLTAPEGELYLQLTSGGDEISELRYAIYDHKMTSHGLDTFLFIEFRTGSFTTYEEIIRQFSKDNPGQYDTLAVERVLNRTRE